MDDPATGDKRPNDVPQRADGQNPTESIEAYETDEGVVLYDAENPLAWVKSTNAVAIGDRL